MPYNRTCSQEGSAGGLPEWVERVVNVALNLCIAGSQPRLNLQQQQHQ
jgi:hypothetical protein